MTTREQILALVQQYYKETFAHKSSYQPGDRIAYGGRQFDEQEMTNLVDSALDFWLTSGRFNQKFEYELAKWLGVKHCRTVNSGSSANLLAFNALTSPLLGDRAIRKGDEVITVAAGFPTTVAPIIQFGAVPVFVDVTIPQYNIDCTRLEDSLTAKTRAVMIAHTMGNPFDIQTVRTFCQKHHLWLVEDNCDALGTQYFIDGEWKYTGTIGDIGTSSFYPPHHITMGEGGAVYTNNPLLNRIIASFRDWGRDCYCPPGKDNTCCHRFNRQYGELPFGYDHKYVYSHLGYNLKITDMQAAIGCAQLEKLPSFVKARHHNWQYLHDKMTDLQDYFELPEPVKNSKPSWFGFLLTLKKNAPFKRVDLIKHLESRNIQTRLLFSGNLIKHPCFDEMRKTGLGYRVIGDLTNTDRILNDTFWIGVYPGMTTPMLDAMVDTIRELCVK